MQKSSAKQHWNLSDEHIQLVKKTYYIFIPRLQEMADMFYAKLFMLEPRVIPLFKSDMPEQGGKFTMLLTSIISALDNYEAFTPVLNNLGMLHEKYGVRREHFNAAGVAFLWAVKLQLDEEFTPEVAEAWKAVYNFMADSMTQTAYDEAA